MPKTAVHSNTAEKMVVLAEAKANDAVKTKKSETVLIDEEFLKGKPKVIEIKRNVKKIVFGQFPRLVKDLQLKVKPVDAGPYGTVEFHINNKHILIVEVGTVENVVANLEDAGDQRVLYELTTLPNGDVGYLNKVTNEVTLAHKMTTVTIGKNGIARCGGGIAVSVCPSAGNPSSGTPGGKPTGDHPTDELTHVTNNYTLNQMVVDHYQTDKDGTINVSSVFNNSLPDGTVVNLPTLPGDNRIVFNAEDFGISVFRLGEADANNKLVVNYDSMAQHGEFPLMVIEDTSVKNGYILMFGRSNEIHFTSDQVDKIYLSINGSERKTAVYTRFADRGQITFLDTRFSDRTLVSDKDYGVKAGLYGRFPEDLDSYMLLHAKKITS